MKNSATHRPDDHRTKLAGISRRRRRRDVATGAGIWTALLLVLTAASWSAGPAVQWKLSSATQPSATTQPSTTQPAQTQPVANGPATLPTAVRSARDDESNAGPPPLSDDQVDRALRRGVDFLLGQFADGQLKPQDGAKENFQAGLDALCVYALLQTSQAIDDPRLDLKGAAMKQMIEKLKGFPMEANPQHVFEPTVYARSLRSSALAVYDRPEDRKALAADVAWLVSQEVDGAYSYGGLFRVQPDPTVAINQNPGVNPVPEADNGRTKHNFTPAAKDPANHVTPQVTLIPPGGGYFVDVVPGPPISNPAPHPPNAAPAKSTPAPKGGTRGPVGPAYVPNGAPPPPPPPPPMFPVAPRTELPKGIYSAFGQAPKPVPPPAPPPPPLPGVARPVINLPPPPMMAQVDFPWDNSNSFYGMMGVWNGAEVGVEVPGKYWEDVEGHWLKSELATAEWGYRAPDPTGSLAMNCGGTTALLVTHDWITAPKLHGALGREIFPKPLAAALDWLAKGDNSAQIGTPHSHYIGYELFGLEQVARACGFKRFGTHDWYRELGQKCVASQWPDGAWGRDDHGKDAIIDTAYVLMFLSSGRPPVFMSKLDFDGNWCNRPRDIANLARFASRELEHRLNWQVVDVKNGWQDWMDSPVLYLASHRPPNLAKADYENLRKFVEAGGLLFTHSDGGSQAFDKWIADDLVPKICPGRPLVTLPDGDPLFSVAYPIRSPHVKLQGVSNGSRWLLIHSTGDLASAWQQRSDKVYRDHFRLGVNLFCYAAGKVDLRNRLVTPLVPDPPPATKPPTQIVRLRYDGNWDPEPYGWTRVSRVWQAKTRSALSVEIADLAKFSAGRAKLCHLTGAGKHDFTVADASAVKAYVNAGGCLLIDACGGSPEFLDSANKLVASAFPGATQQDMPNDHAIYKGLNVVAGAGPRLRPYFAVKMKSPPLRVLKSGKGVVIISTIDISTGLLDTNVYPVCGYAPSCCETIMENLMEWLTMPQKASPATQPTPKR